MSRMVHVSFGRGVSFCNVWEETYVCWIFARLCARYMCVVPEGKCVNGMCCF